LITAATTSSASGLATAQSNIGDMTTTGFEIDLGLVPFKTDNFNWNLRASYATNKSVINSLAQGATKSTYLQIMQLELVFLHKWVKNFLCQGTTFVRCKW
jgi:hypothetical protein